MINPMSLEGKRILVTGASSGIGQAIAILLSELGANVVLVARDQKRLNKTLALLAGEGHLAESMDLALLDDIPAWFAKIIESFGVLDGLVHSAGIQYTAPLQSIQLSDMALMFRINFDAAMMLAQAFRKRNAHNPVRSGIVYISSVASLSGVPGNAAYAATKGALTSLARTLALELARDNIRVNTVVPALVRTELAETLLTKLSQKQREALMERHPLGLGQVEDVAHAVAFLLSEAGRWITGTSLIVDGGYTAQ
ncbi:MAG: SDR family oxidoreductase [Magnetococcus sp. YQC-5]